jgi:group I intron endonuclease
MEVFVSGIYLIENILSGKRYIGQTVDYAKRKASHINALRGNYHPNKYLQSSWNKYGENAFRFTLVIECDVDKLDELEIRYIRQFNTLAPKGFNLTKGGDGVRGLKWSMESREAVSRAKKGKRTGDEAYWFGKKHTPETLEKLRVATSNLWENVEYRQHQVEVHKGKKQSEETKRKRSEALKGNKNNKRAHRYRCVETGIEYESFGQINLGFEIDSSAILRSCRRGIRAYGFHWQIIDAQ